MDSRRFTRHILLKEIGGAGQTALMRARVLIIGMGGLGTPLAQYLVSSGIGALGMADDDRVALDNLHRQILYRDCDIGRRKLDAAADALGGLNSQVVLEAHAMRVGAENITSLIADYDIIADCSDNFATRFCINDACAHAEKPLVSAAMIQFSGQLALFKPYLRDAQDRPLPCYRSLVPRAPDIQDDCATLGVVSALGGVMGSLQAMEIIKEITQSGESLAGFILIYDGLRGMMRRVKLPPSPLFT